MDKVLGYVATDNSPETLLRVAVDNSRQGTVLLGTKLAGSGNHTTVALLDVDGATLLRDMLTQAIKAATRK